MKKVSIVMPVHNTGIYLEEALNSVFSQSFRQFELICVDDASDDMLTKNILREFQKGHDNMNVIELERSVGAAEARNVGFTKTQGEYTIFLDADDLFAPELLEELYDCVRQNGADVGICGYEKFHMSNGKKYFDSKHMPNAFQIFHQISEKWLTTIPMAPWNKLCRTQFLTEKKLYFQDIPSCNDVFFACMALINAKRVCFVDRTPLVYYRTKAKGQISADRNPVNLYKAMILLKNTLLGRIDNELLSKWMGALLLQNGIWELNNSQNESNRKEFYGLVSNFFINNRLGFQSALLNQWAEQMRDLPYESQWWVKDMSQRYGMETIEEHLQYVSDELKEMLAGKRQIFLWGLGQRGDAFQKFCKEESITLKGVTDIKNQQIGKLTNHGNRILHTREVLAAEGFIVASNRSIYEYLHNIGKVKDLLDLEGFYPNKQKG